MMDSDHQFLLSAQKPSICSVILGKNTSPARYDLNESLYEFTVVVATDRFKGLDLDNSVPEELWIEVCNIV